MKTKIDKPHIVEVLTIFERYFKSMSKEFKANLAENNFESLEKVAIDLKANLDRIGLSKHIVWR